MTKTLPTRMLVVLFAAAFSACAFGRRTSGGPRPAWIDGESARWPRSEYVLGVGSADSQNSADAHSRGAVAQVFSATVSVDSSVKETETNGSKNGAASHSFSQTVADNVRTVAKKALEGVSIVARWKDPTTFRYYALAALPKAEALRGVTEKLHDLDQETQTYQSQLDQATDRFSRAKAASKLLALVKSRGDLENDNRILGGGDDPGPVDAGTVRAAAAKALAALDVVVAVTGDGAQDVATGVITGLNAVGLSAKSGVPTDSSDLMAQAQVTVQPVEASPGWQRSRADATVSLSDGRTGATFARLAPTAREDALDPIEARRRALASLAKQTAQAVQKAIESFFADQ